jgi:hypothetical protein
MKSRRPPRLGVVLLQRLVPDNEPLIGDLLEAWGDRSDGWFWKQVMLVAIARTAGHLRTNLRATIETVLVTTAMLVLLGFQAVVAAGFLNHLFGPHDTTWMPRSSRYDESLVWSAVTSFVTAALVGRAVSRFQRDQRVAAVLAFGASATTAALLNLYLFVPNMPPQSFMPSATLQIAMAMVFVVGLFVGIGSRSLCEPLPFS